MRDADIWLLIIALLIVSAMPPATWAEDLWKWIKRVSR